MIYYNVFKHAQIIYFLPCICYCPANELSFNVLEFSFIVFTIEIKWSK